MLDGDTQHYYIPKSTINTTPHIVSNNLDMKMDMNMDIDSVSYNHNKSNKPSKPKTRKPRKPRKPSKPRKSKPGSRKSVRRKLA